MVTSAKSRLRPVWRPRPTDDPHDPGLSRSLEARPGGAHSRVHRDGRAGRLVAPGLGRGTRRVVGHRSEHPGAARRRGVRAAAAHLGRPLPTDRGYRFYVDHAARIEAFDAHGQTRSKRGSAATYRAASRFGAVAGVARGLAGVAAVGFALPPGARGPRCSIASNSSRSARTRVLVVIVARGSQVIQKVIEISEPLDADDLRQASNYLNAEFSGLPLASGAPGRARAHRRRTVAVRRALRPRDAARHLDVREPGRRAACSSWRARRCCSTMGRASR